MIRKSAFLNSSRLHKAHEWSLKRQRSRKKRLKKLTWTCNSPNLFLMYLRIPKICSSSLTSQRYGKNFSGILFVANMNNIFQLFFISATGNNFHFMFSQLFSHIPSEPNRRTSYQRNFIYPPIHDVNWNTLLSISRKKTNSMYHIDSFCWNLRKLQMIFSCGGFFVDRPQGRRKPFQRPRQDAFSAPPHSVWRHPAQSTVAQFV